MTRFELDFPNITQVHKLRRAFQNLNTGLEHANGGIWPTPPSSPTSSSSASEEEDRFGLTHIRSLSPLQYDHGGIPDISSSNAPFPDTVELNPYATAFVPQPSPPLPTPPRSLLRPARDPTMLQPQITKWLRTFQRATSPTFDAPYNALALILVHADPWRAETMAELTQEISWKAAEATPEDLETVITMTELIYLQVREMRGQHFANSFLWHLEETLLWTFLNVWGANHHGMAISYQSRPSEQYVVSATRLGIFIAELYRRNLIETQLVEVCLETLVSNFVSVEHADAIQAIFLHIGPTYWFRHPKGPAHIDRFGQAIITVGQKLRGEMSLIDQPRSDENLQDLLHRICVRCQQWSTEMMKTTSRRHPGGGRTSMLLKEHLFSQEVENLAM